MRTYAWNGTHSQVCVHKHYSRGTVAEKEREKQREDRERVSPRTTRFVFSQKTL